LRQGHEWATTGHNSKTLVKYPDLRIVLTAIRANARINEHKTAARISVQVLSGHIRMEVDGMLFDLPAGELLALDQAMPHDVAAVEDSAFLITLAWSEGLEKH
jgi:quercetin dioxygenase-like cupin family protein